MLAEGCGRRGAAPAVDGAIEHLQGFNVGVRETNVPQESLQNYVDAADLTKAWSDGCQLLGGGHIIDAGA